MSPPGRPKGEFRSAQHEGSPMSPPGRPKGEFRSAQHEGSPVNTPHLITTPNFRSTGRTPLHAYTPGDDFIERLVAAHRGLGDDASRLLNARLVLLLANHIGDPAVLGEALAAARAGLDSAEPDTAEETR